jgi:Domain of unknown function (DUF4407)
MLSLMAERSVPDGRTFNIKKVRAFTLLEKTERLRSWKTQNSYALGKHRTVTLLENTMVKNFLLFCSGTNPAIIKLCPSETTNRVGSGGAVLFTAIIAAIGFHFHMLQVCHTNPLNLIPFDLLWGLGIFSLDRWLVGTMVVGNSVKEALKRAWMRLVLSVIFGAFASDALILRTFEGEINNYLSKRQMVARQTAQETLTSRPIYKERAAKMARIAEMESGLEEARKSWNNAERDAKKELDESVASRRAGDGPVYQQKRAIAKSLQADYEQSSRTSQAAIAELQQEVQKIEVQRDAELKVIDETERLSGGHAARLEALGELMRSNSAVAFGAIISWLIIMIIDSLAIVLKISQAGQGKHAYDKLQDELSDGEIKIGTAVLRADVRAVIDTKDDEQKKAQEHREMVAEARTRINKELIAELEKAQLLLIQTVYLPAAAAQIANQMQRHVAQMQGTATPVKTVTPIVQPAPAPTQSPVLQTLGTPSTP